jgi:hypothetical protein
MQCPIITSASSGPRYTRCDDSEGKDLEVQGLRGGLYRNNKIFSSDTNLITMKHYFYYQPIGKAMVSLPQRNARTSRGYRTWPSWPIAKVIPFPSIHLPFPTKETRKPRVSTNLGVAAFADASQTKYGRVFRHE